MATVSLAPSLFENDQSQIETQITHAAFTALLIIGYHYQ